MKFWVLKNSESLPLKLELYPRAAKELGFDVEIVDVTSISAIRAANYFSLIKDGKEVLNDDYPDAVIVVCRTFGYEHLQLWGAELVQHLSKAGVVVGNDFASRSLADNKWLTHQCLIAENIVTPETLLLSREADLESFFSAQKYPLVLKTTFGHKGEGVFLCNSQLELAESIQKIDKRKTIIIQEYLPETHGRDVRAFVVGDKVVATMKRSAASQGFKANLAANGIGEVFTLSEDQKQLAINATKALGLYYAGVDLLFKTDTQLVVGEVNANPGLGIEVVTGVSVAEEVCAYLAELVTKKNGK